MTEQTRIKNVLPQTAAGYAGLGEELKAYLHDTYSPQYGETYNFDVSVGRTTVQCSLAALDADKA